MFLFLRTSSSPTKLRYRKIKNPDTIFFNYLEFKSLSGNIINQMNPFYLLKQVIVILMGEISEQLLGII